MNKKIIAVVLVLALAMVIAGAGVMYKDLRDEVQAQQLAALMDTEPEESETAADATDATEPERIVLPDFTVYDLEGNAYMLSDFRGKPVVLNFWASWCVPCKSEMPVFEEKAAELAGEVQFLMVNLTDGTQETVETASAFIQEQGYTFPVYYDTYQSAALAFGVYSIPVTYFIDAEGYGVAYASGGIGNDVLQKGIDMIYE